MIGNLSDLKDKLGISGKTDLDGVLYGYLREAERWVVDFCGRQFVRGDYTEWFYDVEDVVYVKEYPIESVNEVEVDGVNIDVSGLTIKSDIGEIKGIKGEKVRVNYRGGYSVVPDTVKSAVEMIAMALFIEGQGAINVVEGQETIYKPSYLIKRAEEILSRWRG